MRRLAVQSRNDAYLSKKDYQHLDTKISQRIGFTTNTLILQKKITLTGGQKIIGFGGFIYPPNNTNLKLMINVNGQEVFKYFTLINNWNRVGLCFTPDAAGVITIIVSLTFENSTSASFWGVDIGEIFLPDEMLASIKSIEELNVSSLSPESYYFPHNNDSEIQISGHQGSISIDAGEPVRLKKCSFCQRDLPLREDVLGVLSFHKHNAKKTKHQNECRACKKWRINDVFNPLRTTDQLHESSVITRERKILLREPMILAQIKERTGAGLKSQVWERFNRRCFYCNIPVKLNEFQLDHTRPLAYLWPIDEYATCLCAEHNNLKKDKFPVDFYTSDQLFRLSEITGMPYEKLVLKDVNESELNRIIQNIVNFSMEWDARTFYAIARKVLEIRPNIDLLSILRSKSVVAFEMFVQKYEDRPD